MATKTADLRYGSQFFHSRKLYLGIEFDHADNDRFIRVVWLNENERSPWEIKQAINERGVSASDSHYV